MSFEQTVGNITTWLEDLKNTVDEVNAGVTDNIPLTMPRKKDLFVTYQGDDEGKPEQLPAAVLQLEDGVSDPSNNVSQFKGTLIGTLYLVDDAGSLIECRTKLARWVEAIKRHCFKPTAILGSYSRVSLRGLTFNIGKDAGDMNTLVVRADIVFPTIF